MTCKHHPDDFGPALPCSMCRIEAKQARAIAATFAVSQPTEYSELDYKEGLGVLAGAIQYLARRDRLDDAIVGVEVSSRDILERACREVTVALYPWRCRYWITDRSAARDH